MNHTFLTTHKEIDLTVLDDSAEIENPRATIFWGLDIDSNDCGITGMTPRIVKIEAEWDVRDGDGLGPRKEVIEHFKGKQIGLDRPNSWELIEDIVPEFGSFYVDELIIDLNDWSATIIYNRLTK